MKTNQKNERVAHNIENWIGASCGFEYPDEIEGLLEDGDLRDLMDEFATDLMFKSLAVALNRVVNEIITAENPTERAIVIAWACGIQVDNAETMEDFLGLLSRRGITRSPRWMFEEKKKFITSLKQ